MGDNYLNEETITFLNWGKKMKLSVKKLVVLALASLTFAHACMADDRVTKEERVLLVLSELDSTGAPEMEGLYRVLEDMTSHMTRAILRDKYRSIIFLKDQQATLPNFKRAIYELANTEGVMALDVMISVHGSPNALSFREGAYTKERIRDFILETSTRQEQVRKIFVKKKLRALYNLACYGGRNMSVMKDIGFAVTNGARGVNANSEVELVPALTAWANGAGFKNAFAASNNPVALAIADAPVRAAGTIANNSLREVNSEKVFLGEVDITINSPATR